jgi:Tol biopolymer transport system component
LANFTSDVFLLDRQARTIVRVSLTSTGQQANNASGSPAITPDGRFVVFESSALLLAGEVEDFASDFYLRDVQACTTEGISTVGTRVAPAQRGADDKPRRPVRRLPVLGRWPGARRHQ